MVLSILSIVRIFPVCHHALRPLFLVCKGFVLYRIIVAVVHGVASIVATLWTLLLGHDILSLNSDILIVSDVMIEIHIALRQVSS